MGLSVDVGRMTHGARRAVWLGSLMLCVSGVAEAQEASRLRVAVHYARVANEPTGLNPSSSHSVVVSDSTRGHPILRGAGIGLLAGAGAGLVYALVLNANSKCNLPGGVGCSHSEDGLAFVVLPIYGAFLGTIAGAVTGAIVR